MTSSHAATIVPPKRSVASVLILLLMVLSITAQLLTGLYMTVTGHKSIGLIHTHAGIGTLAVVIVLLEWIWLLTSPSGRFRLRSFVSKDAGPIEWSEGLLLVVASVTIFLGATLASSMYLGVQLSATTRQIVFKAHQGLAQLVAGIYVVHTILAIVRGQKRAAARRLAQQNTPEEGS